MDKSGSETALSDLIVLGWVTEFYEIKQLYLAAYDPELVTQHPDYISIISYVTCVIYKIGKADYIWLEFLIYIRKNSSVANKTHSYQEYRFGCTSHGCIVT